MQSRVSRIRGRGIYQNLVGSIRNRDQVELSHICLYHNRKESIYLENNNKGDKA